MFPTATTTPTDTGRQAINRNFNDLDSLIGELSVPKEQINKTIPGAPQNSAGNNQFIPGSNEIADIEKP